MLLLGNKGAVLVVFDNEALELDGAIFVVELDQGRHLSGDVQRGRAVNRGAFPEDLLPQNRGRTEQEQHVEELLAGFRFEIETFVSRVVLERGLEEGGFADKFADFDSQILHDALQEGLLETEPLAVPAAADGPAEVIEQVADPESDHVLRENVAVNRQLAVNLFPHRREIDLLRFVAENRFKLSVSLRLSLSL